MKTSRFAQWVILSYGWRRAVIAFAAGSVSTLALAPFHLWPVLFLTFPIVVWLIDGASAVRWSAPVSAAAVGWAFGFGYFVSGLYWIGHAFLVDADKFAWLLPLAVVGLPAYLAVFTALGFALARALWMPGAARILALAASLTAAEWLRGHALTGFPWNAFGYALTGPLPLAQGAALFGVWGLTFLAIAVFSSPAVLADDPEVTRRRWLAPALSLFALAALAVFGVARLASAPTDAFVEGVRLRIMQPNIPQDERFRYSAKQSVMRRYAELSNVATESGSQPLGGATHLIWPESAFPFFLAREPDVLADIANLLPAGTVLITGAARAAPATPAGGLRAYNSVYVIDHDGAILSTYDKTHLVPFGEYLPFQELLESLGLSQLANVPGGFLAGPRRTAIEPPRAPAFVPLICYEIIFPAAAVHAGARPGFMLNLTNDGWFGISTGPYQHLQQARVRAIEEGLPLVRAANTGISAVVDPLGRVVASLPLGTRGILDAQLPRPAEPTFYVDVRNGPLGLMLAIILAGLMIRRLRAKRAV